MKCVEYENVVNFGPKDLKYYSQCLDNLAEMTIEKVMPLLLKIVQYLPK